MLGVPSLIHQLLSGPHSIKLSKLKIHSTWDILYFDGHIQAVASISTILLCSLSAGVPAVVVLGRVLLVENIAGGVPLASGGLVCRVCKVSSCGSHGSGAGRGGRGAHALQGWEHGAPQHQGGQAAGHPVAGGWHSTGC